MAEKTRKIDKKYYICDICGVEIKENFTKCSFCNRDICRDHTDEDVYYPGRDYGDTCCTICRQKISDKLAAIEMLYDAINEICVQWTEK